MAREGFTEPSPMVTCRCFSLGNDREVVEEGRGNKVQGGDRTYPTRLAEPPLKERVEGHGVFPTTGQTAVCKKACTQLVTAQDQ